MFLKKPHPNFTQNKIWVRPWRGTCLVTWFCYHLIAKPGDKTTAPSWPDPYANFNLRKCIQDVIYKMASILSPPQLCRHLNCILWCILWETLAVLWNGCNPLNSHGILLDLCQKWLFQAPKSIKGVWVSPFKDKRQYGYGVVNLAVSLNYSKWLMLFFAL